MEKIKEPTCRFGHQCTSGCGNDFDCPCQVGHCCAMTEDCDGSCDDCYRTDMAELEKDNQLGR